MYSIIQKIYEKNNKILKEGLKEVLNGADVSTLTGAIKDFTDILGKELFSEIVTQIENLVFDDVKRKNQYGAVRFAEKSLVTTNNISTTVKADSTNSDSNNKWYDYNNKMWANAVLVDSTNRSTYQSAAVGTTINSEDILAHYVWIPRYKYKVWNIKD